MITNIIFIPLYGITGAAIASAISIFLLTRSDFCSYYTFSKIQPFSLNTLKVLGVFLLTLLVSYIITPI
ncbi:MAG: hypothetical protein IPI19_18940 [Ignavibacteriales bacterium]|nr:hypothetical protein [Ignavibacteriales bacterium]